MKLPIPSGRMTVTYGMDQRVKVPVWDEEALKKAIADERKAILDILDEHCRSVDVREAVEIIKARGKT